MGRIRLRPSGTALARSVCTMPVWPACTVPGAAHGAGRLSTGRSCDAGSRRVVAARCWIAAGDAAALSNGGAPGSGTSVWILAPGDGSGHGERG
jgi:hypothetical protein